MPYSNVFAKINTEYYQLTSAEKKVADFVAIHQQKTQYMSISELAEECGVAEATISRFCRRLGYKGYNAFKLAVANCTAGRAAANPLTGEVLPEDSIGDMCQKIYAADVEAMRETLGLIRPETVQLAADILLAADRVYTMGQGGSMILAEEGAHLFSTVRSNFFPVWDSHLQAITASQMTERDVVIYFSYSGATKELLDVSKIVHQRGGKIVLITRFPKSPGAVYANVILQCGAKEGPLQLGSIAARISQLYLIDVLFSEMCRRDMEGCKLRREQIADALVDKHV